MAGDVVKTIWDVPLERLYKLVLQFYRKEKECIRLEYGQKIKLMALYKQEKLGPYSAEKDTETGYLDIIGSDRRKAWQVLGNMGEGEARRALISLLDAATPKLHEYVLREWKVVSQQDHQSHQGQSPTPRVLDSPKANESVRKLEQNTRIPIESSEWADDDEVDREGSSGQQNGHPDVDSLSLRLTTGSNTGARSKAWSLVPAALWCTPKAAGHFISQVQGVPNSCVRINPNEVIDVLVPTNGAASAVFWEFVAVGGAMGFGLTFLPKGEAKAVELLSVVKRDCTQDIVHGCHHYQQVDGTYSLHFDNSNSDKAILVYYRVFYQRLL